MYVLQVVNAGLKRWRTQAGELHALSKEVFFVRSTTLAVSSESVYCFSLDVLLTLLS